MSEHRRYHLTTGKWKITAVVVSGLLIFLLAVGSPSRALQATVDLGTADSFAVLAGSEVTNTGPTEVNGDLGVSPGTAVSGFPPGIVNGATHTGTDAVAVQAQSDLTTAYNDAAGRDCPPDNDLTDEDLGGMLLTTGVYCFSSSAQLTGPLILDAQGDPLAVFIFQVGSTLTTASASSVNLINSAEACNVFWQIGSSATLGTDTSFQGTILALTSISLTTGATIIEGRALARNAAVTMDTNTITSGSCVSSTPTPTPTATSTATPTASPTATPTASPTATPTASPTATPTASPTASATASPTATPTASSTATPTATAAPAGLAADSLTPTPSPSSTPTATSTTLSLSNATPSVSVLSSSTTSRGESTSAETVLPRSGSHIGLYVLVGLGLIAIGDSMRRAARRSKGSHTSK